MLLVNQLQITLKDFWPDQAEAMVINDRDRGTTTTISRRLYAKLKAYAADNRLPFDSIVQQLREEIHGPTTAKVDPPAAKRKFAKGDRVKLSPNGVQIMPRMSEDRSGTVAFNHGEGNWVAVLWDGTHRPRYMNPVLLEQSDD